MASPKTTPAAQPQPNAQRDHRPERGRHQALDDRPGHGDPADGEQFLEVEVQPDAEHQQDDADLGQLLGQVPVGDEAGRVRPDDDPGQQVADDRRQPEPVRDVAEARGRRPGRRSGSGSGRVRACPHATNPTEPPTPVTPFFNFSANTFFSFSSFGPITAQQYPCRGLFA